MGRPPSRAGRKDLDHPRGADDSRRLGRHVGHRRSLSRSFDARDAGGGRWRSGPRGGEPLHTRQSILLRLLSHRRVPCRRSSPRRSASRACPRSTCGPPRTTLSDSRLTRSSLQRPRLCDSAAKLTITSVRAAQQLASRDSRRCRRGRTRCGRDVGAGSSGSWYVSASTTTISSSGCAVEPVPHVVRADEAGAAGDEQPHVRAAGRSAAGR